MLTRVCLSVSVWPVPEVLVTRNDGLNIRHRVDGNGPWSLMVRGVVSNCSDTTRTSLCRSEPDTSMTSRSGHI